MKVLTEHAGAVEIKPKMVFEHAGHKLAICDIPFKYMNSPDLITIRDVVDFRTGVRLGVDERKTTLLSLKNKAAEKLDRAYRAYAGFSKRYKAMETLNEM